MRSVSTVPEKPLSFTSITVSPMESTYTAAAALIGSPFNGCTLQLQSWHDINMNQAKAMSLAPTSVALVKATMMYASKASV
jgi:hypothetical protein